MELLIDSNEMLKYLPESGQILSTLRNNLISVLGMDRAKGFLLRYGWDCGESFSNHLKRKDAYNSFTLEDLFKSGSQIHGSTADLGISVTKLKVNPETKEYYSEGYWKYSREAEIHLKNFGLSDEPVCFTLIGYAGGYVSCILGKQVIFKEVECRGKGDPHCHWVAKPVDDWGDEIQKELPYYKEENLGQELDRAFIRIEEQKEVFKKALKISEKLSNAILNNCGLQGLLSFMEKEMNVLVTLEDVHLKLIKSSSAVEMNELHSEFVKKELKKFVHCASPSKKTILLKNPPAEGKEFYKRLASPIFLRNKLFGFVSFLKKAGDFTELDYLMIERASSVCAIQILNETSAFENEQRLKEELLNGIFQGEFPQEDLIYRLKLMGYNIEQPQYVFVFHIEKDHHPRQLLDDPFMDFKKGFVEQLYNTIERRKTNCIISTRVNQIIAVIPDEFVRQFPSLVTCGTWLFNQLFPKSNHFEVILGMSTLCQKVRDLKKGLVEAEKTISMMSLSKSQVKVKSFKELGAIAKFIEPGNFSEIKIFAHHLLDEINVYDEKYDSGLLSTLYWYIENNGHMKNTAKDMRVSLGSVRYRLNRIQEIGGFDLSTSQGFFDAHVAVQVFLLLGLIAISTPKNTSERN